jgi:Fe-S oxidoreductase
LRKRARTLIDDQIKVSAVGHTRGRVVLFATCYGNYNEPNLGEDLIAVFQHNEIAVRLADKERCCGMPKLELGDLKAITRAKDANIPVLAKLVDEGYDIVAPIPSCVLMFKQELPLIFPGDADVTKVSEATYDPFEYLMLRHKEGKLKHDFKQSLGKISYHVPCHLRVQNIGLKTREALELVPDTKVEPIERCSGHNGTYAVKKEFHETSMRIGRPVVQRIEKSAADYYSSDCPMAGHQIENGLKQPKQPDHPMALLRKAYDI